jgi:hypothetical protein
MCVKNDRVKESIFRMLVKDDRVKESASTGLYWCKDLRGLSNQNVTVRFCELVCDCGP